MNVSESDLGSSVQNLCSHISHDRLQRGTFLGTGIEWDGCKAPWESVSSHTDLGASLRQKVECVTRRWGEGKVGTCHLMGTDFLFRKMEKSWKWKVVTVTQQCE